MRGRFVICLVAATAGFAGCVLDGTEVDDPWLEGLLESEEPLDDDADLELGKADGHTLPTRLVPGNIAIPTHLLNQEIHTVFRTEQELEDALGIANPGVDFSTEWAVFYNPGLDALRPGSRAWIDTVWLSQTGWTILASATLEHNGAGCPPRSSRPFRLVAVRAPEVAPRYKRIYRRERTLECGVEHHDGISFTTVQARGALAAANLASIEELDDAGIRGTQASIIIDGRTWPSLAAVANTYGIGPITMTNLRDLGEAF